MKISLLGRKQSHSLVGNKWFLAIISDNVTIYWPWGNCTPWELVNNKSHKNSTITPPLKGTSDNYSFTHPKENNYLASLIVLVW